jgi:hypothetical protein
VQPCVDMCVSAQQVPEHYTWCGEYSSWLLLASRCGLTSPLPILTALLLMNYRCGQ